jgi:predicted ATPase
VPLTRFIGRERELAQLAELLATARLVTVTGPPGTGKTRLARELLARVGDRFGDPTFVALATTADPDLVAPAIGRGLGLRDATPTGLVGYLRDRRALLVLDNFEQIVVAGPLLAELVAASRELAVLVTSRMPLRVLGEQELPLAPLGERDAVRLFVDRARAARPDAFAGAPDAVGADDEAALAELCRRLDGLPLAIELAAARIREFSPRAMLGRLGVPGGGLGLLAEGPRDLPERQRTLRDAIAWSHDLLSEAEQRVFRRLGVFVGGWTLEAAEVVAGGGPPAAGDSAGTVDCLAALVEHSLVRPVGDGRYDMLETLREYARGRLGAAGESDALARRHAAYFLGLAAQPAAREFGSEAQVAWLDALADEPDNLSAALRHYAEAEEVAAGQQLAVALAPLWVLRDVPPEHGWLRRFLSRTGADLSDFDPSDQTGLCMAGLNKTWPDLDAIERSAREDLDLAQRRRDSPAEARALFALGLVLTHYRPDPPAATRAWSELAALSRAQGDRFAYGVALLARTGRLREDGDLVGASAAGEEACATFRASRNLWGSASAAMALGRVAFEMGDGRRAEALYGEAAAVYERLDDCFGIVNALTLQGEAARVRGDLTLAADRHHAALDKLRWLLSHSAKRDVARRTGDTWNVLERVGLLAADLGQAERALRLLGAGQAHRESIVSPRAADEERPVAAARALATNALGEAAAEAAHAAGRAMSLEEAISCALAASVVAS